MPTLTNLDLTYPTPLDPAYADIWGGLINAILVDIDSEFATKTFAQNFADNELTRPELKDYSESINALGNQSGTVTVDMEDGNHATMTLTGNVTTLTISNPPSSGSLGILTLQVKQDATGSRSFSWPSAVKWAGGTAPTITSTATRTDIYVLRTTDGGTTWAGLVAGQDYSGL